MAHYEQGNGDGGAGRNKTSDDDKKIFVGGLSWETKEQDFRDYFSKFGEVKDCTLKTDPTTGKSRGFGFVTFTSMEDVDKVINEHSHTLHGRNIDPKRAKARPGPEKVKKVFVGGLDPELPEADIRTYFGAFGKIAEINLPYDKFKNSRRAFAFISFDAEESAEDCCKNAKHIIGGKEVDVKKAVTKPQEGAYGWGFDGRGGGRGGRGFGRGGRGGRGGYNDWANQGSGYDYNYGNYGYDGYGGYGGYDYDYYNQGWGNNQGYDSSSYGNYGNYGGGGTNYDYGSQASTGYKGGNTGYHPYNK